MARDYKNRSAPKRKKTTKKTTAKSGLPTPVWFVAGVLTTLGLVWAKGQWLDSDSADTPRELTPYSARMEENSEAEKKPEKKKPVTEKKSFELKKDPRFTFYERLPKDEVIISQEALEVEVDRNKNKEPLEAITKAGDYILQAGSFREFTDADRRKAELALLGLESAIQKVSIDESNWFRVRIGPFTDLDKLNNTRQILGDAAIDALVMRTK